MRRSVLATGLLCQLLAPTSVPGAERVLTITEGTNFAVTVGPDGTTVLDLQGALTRLPGTKLTDGRGDDRLPRFSPDGRQLVFQTFRSGDFDIWKIPAAGGKATAVTAGPDDDREPVWFPDSRHIAFTSDRNGNLDIWQQDLATGTRTPLTTDPADDYWPAVSPDGTRLAFVSDRGGMAGLYIQPLTPARAPAELVASGKAGRPVAPAWSPDGHTLAFARAVEQIGFPAIARYELTLLDLATRATRVLSATGDDVFPFAPSWLKDGGLAWTANGGIQRWHSGGALQAQAFSLSLPVTTADFRQKPFRPAERPQAALGIVEPVTAPDGGVIFAALGDLWRRKPGGELRQLTDDAFVERDPAVAPDGRSLAFISDRGGSMQVWLRDLNSGIDRSLTRMPRGVRYPTFAPDGQSLAFQQAGPRGNQDFTLHRVALTSGVVTAIRAPPLWPGRMGFSTDGQHLLVAALTASSARFREGRNVLRAIDLETGSATTVALPPGLTSDTGPVLAADGRTAALVIDGELWLLALRPDGSAAAPPQRRIAGLADYPSFSADGRTLTWLATGGLWQTGVEAGRPRALPVPLTWTPAAGSGTVLIRAGRLFDGTGTEYQRNVDVLIEKHRIIAFGADLVVPPGTPVIDARHATVMPGLIDNHAHHQGHDGAWVGRAWLAFGVTSVLEPGGLPYESRENYEAWASGRRPGPRLFYAGPQLDGRQRFFPFASHITSDRRLKLELERAQWLGYSLIKTYTRMPVSRESRTIRAAHRLGLPVSSHEIYPAFALGGDRVEHLRGSSRLGWSSKQSDGLRMYGDAVQIVGASGSTMVPTLVVGGGFLDVLLRHPEIDALPQYAGFYPEADRRALRALAGLAGRKRALFDSGLANSRRAVRELATAGARIIAGTDAPIFPYGLSLVAELRALKDAGLSGAAVLRSATSDAAAAIGASDQLGRIAPGMLADLLIVDGDPLADPLELVRLEMVFSNGVAGPRATLPALPAIPAQSP
jgi:Tol biopolymer transport system component/imidazolonepropionase-like amidohydrolase